MENKYLFEVDTSWLFPILRYTTNTSYVEVRKASGIAYILLQLINSSDNSSEKLVATLKSLGVPNDIHYIFASELSYMISIGIVKMKTGQEFRVEIIDMYPISDFEITELGKKLFREGTIPTGNNKTKKINTFYDVARKNTQINFDLKLFRLENSTLDTSCVGDVILNNSDVEAFISENINKYSFRKGERISGFEHEAPEIFVYKMDDAVALRISQEGVIVQARDKERDAFIHKFYSVDTIARIIETKKKYRFPEFIASEIKEYDFHEMPGITKVYMPSQISVVTKVKSALSLGGKCDIYGTECALDSSESIELMYKCGIEGIACYFENGKLYAIIPGRFLLDVEGYSEKCSINLIVLQQQSEDVRQRLMREVFLKCIEALDPLEKSNIIRKLTQISQCKDYLEQFSSSLLHNERSLTNRIELFLRINEKFEKDREWNDYSKESAKSLFDTLCAQITVDGFAAQNILGKKLSKIIGLNDIEYISRISKKIVDNEGEIIAFEALEEADFDVDVILSVVNVFELYCRQIIDNFNVSGNSKLSSQCALLGKAFSELKDLTGILNPYEDSAELDFEQDRFSRVITTFTDAMKKVEKYKMFAMEEYRQLSLFKERFIEIKEVVTIEKEAIKNPKNINRNYIEQRLKKSRYKDAICDLHVRLQYELNRIFNTDNVPTFDLLSNQEILNYLDEQEIDKMHALRKCRNGFQHPKGKRDVQYSENTIREWSVVVEKLGGMTSESRSKD